MWGLVIPRDSQLTAMRYGIISWLTRLDRCPQSINTFCWLKAAGGSEKWDCVCVCVLRETRFSQDSLAVRTFVVDSFVVFERTTSGPRHLQASDAVILSLLLEPYHRQSALSDLSFRFICLQWTRLCLSWLEEIRREISPASNIWCDISKSQILGNTCCLCTSWSLVEDTRGVRVWELLRCFLRYELLRGFLTDE